MAESEDSLLTDALRFRSQYHEVDSMHFVYYGMYLNWFTRGRIELLRKLGLSYAELESGGMFLPVLRVDCQYRAPVGLDEWVRMETEMVECRRTRMAFVYRVWREGETTAAEGQDLALCAVGRTEHAFMDARGKPVDLRKRFPEVWRVLEKSVEV